MLTADTLAQAGWRELSGALNALTNNSPGFNPTKDARTRFKLPRFNVEGVDYPVGICNYLLANFDHDAVLQAVNAAQVNAGKAPITYAGKPAQQEPAMPTPAAAPVVVNRSGDALKALQDILAGSIDEGRIAAIARDVALEVAKGAVSEERVREIANEAAAGVQGRQIDIRVNNAPVVKIEGAHPLFEKVLRLAQAGMNVALVGPAGCGKTYLSEQVAATLGVPYASLSYTSGASESWLLGRFLPTGEGGRFEYQTSAFCTNYTVDSVFCHDEFDAADPNMTLIINKATANGGFDNPISGAHLKRKLPSATGCGAVQIACLNTFGTGANLVYGGRNALDAAALDRWYFILMDYDAGLEAKIAGLPYKPGKAWQAAPEATDQELAELGDWVIKLRGKAQTAGLRRVVSTRAIQKAVAARKARIPSEEIKRDLVLGWTKDELAKVGL